MDGAGDSLYNWGGIGQALTQIVKDNTRTDDPTMLVLNTFHLASFPEDSMKTSPAPCTRRRPRKENKGAQAMFVHQIRSAIAAGQLSQNQVADFLRKAVTEDALTSLKPSIYVEGILQVMQVTHLQLNKRWIAHVAQLLLSRVNANPKSDSTHEHGSATPEFTAKQLAELLWAIGLKGGYAIENEQWAVALSHALVQRCLLSSDRQKWPNRSLELVGIAAKVQGLKIASILVLPEISKLLAQILQEQNSQCSSELQPSMTFASLMMLWSRLERVTYLANNESIKNALIAGVTLVAAHAEYSDFQAGLKIALEQYLFFQGHVLTVIKEAVRRHTTSIISSPGPSIGKVAETMARLHVLPSSTLDKICRASSDYLTGPKGQEVDPKTIGRWCLQLAASGAVFEGFFDAAVVACLRSLARGLESRRRGSKKGTKGWPILSTNPPRIASYWIVGLGSQFASAGVIDPEFYFSLAEFTLNTTQEEEIAVMHQVMNTDDTGDMNDHHNSYADRYAQNTSAVSSMLAGTFSFISTVPMLLTHTGDTQMHIHMTPSGCLQLTDSVESSVKHALQKFSCPHLPIMIDIGCGRGSWLLGLAKYDAPEEQINYLGIERSAFLVQKAIGMASRLGIDCRVQFISGPVEIVLSEIIKQVGEQCCSTVSCQFPTPFVATTSNDGDQDIAKQNMLTDFQSSNSQLPALEGFALSLKVIDLVVKLLKSEGRFFVQSNTEEIVVHIHKILSQRKPLNGVGVDHVNQLVDIDSGDSTLLKISNRSDAWRTYGGSLAEGLGWTTSNPWSMRCGVRSESEVRYEEQSTRLFRLLFEKGHEDPVCQPLRLPSEWESVSHIWVGWPILDHEWKGLMQSAQDEIVAFMQCLLNHDIEVHVAVGTKSAARYLERCNMTELKIICVPCDDIWLRDTAPILGIKKRLNNNGNFLHASVFRFNAWGGKFDFPNDKKTAAAIANLENADISQCDCILEGGSIEHNGNGLFITTKECLLNSNRNGWDVIQANEALKSNLGANDIIWLERGLTNDHTDGHVDNIARFVSPDEVVCHRAAGADDPNAELYGEIQYRLQQTDLKVTTIVSPGRVNDDDGAALPASYLNFVIVNGLVIVPTFGTDTTDEAINELQSIFKSHKVVGLSALNILKGGGGAFHCMTCTVPSV